MALTRGLFPHYSVAVEGKEPQTVMPFMRVEVGCNSRLVDIQAAVPRVEPGDLPPSRIGVWPAPFAGGASGQNVVPFQPQCDALMSLNSMYTRACGIFRAASSS